MLKNVENIVGCKCHDRPRVTCAPVSSSTRAESRWVALLKKNLAGAALKVKQAEAVLKSEASRAVVKSEASQQS